MPRIKACGHRELVPVVSHGAEISVGEWVTVSGTGVNDREHGQQFKANYRSTSPLTIAQGIKRVMTSGMTW